jgi:hypothetical protein
MAEAILCFICIIIGGILALVFGSSIRKTQGGTIGSSTCLMVTGLVFSCLVRLYLQLFVGELMFYLRSVRLYLQLFVGELMFYLRSVRLYLQ